MSTNINKLAQGTKFGVFEIKKNDESEISNFFLKLNANDKNRIMRQINHIADNGPLNNIEKFRHEGDGIYAIKQNQIRIYCFFHAGKMIILTHGFIKKSRKPDPKQLEKAIDIKNCYLSSLKMSK